MKKILTALYILSTLYIWGYPGMNAGSMIGSGFINLLLLYGTYRILLKTKEMGKND